MKRQIGWMLMVLLAASTWAGAELPADATGTRPTVDGEATQIVVGLYLIDVSRITGADQTFTADLFVLQQWRDHRLAGAFESTRRVALEEIWTPRLQILNRRDLQTTFPEQAEVSPDGVVVTRQRFFGEFASPFELHDFPLDRQRFEIRLVVPGHASDEINLVAAPPEVAGGNRRENFSIPDWDIGEVSVDSEPFSVSGASNEIAGFVLDFEGRRHLGFWAGKAFISVAIIVAMSWVVFWLDPKFVAPRLSVAVTSMLTLIAYRFLLGAVLPRLSYLTRMDYFLIGSTLLVLITVIQVVVTTQAADRDHGRRAARINLHSRWVFPSAFLLLMALSFFTV